MRGSTRGFALTELQQTVGAGLPSSGPDPPADTVSTAALGLGEKPATPARLAWRRFRRHKLAMAGVVAGYYGKWLDNVLMRVTDLFLAIPFLVSAIIVSELPANQQWAEQLFGKAHSLRSVITVMALFFWMPVARIIRGMVLSLKEK